MIPFKCLFAEMTCDFAFCTRKLSLSRPRRFDVFVPRLTRLRLTFTGPETYRRYSRCSHNAGCFQSAVSIQIPLSMPLNIKPEICRLSRYRLRHYDVKLSLPYIMVDYVVWRHDVGL